MFVAKGNRIVAPLLGFCEVLIWLLALDRIMKNLSNTMTYLAYGPGFAMENFVGISVENKLTVGVCIILIITRMKAENLVKSPRDAGYSITSLDAQDSSGIVGILNSIIGRGKAADLIKKSHSNIYYGSTVKYL